MILLFQLLGGFALLLAGGEVLVRGSVSLANRMRISPLVIGLTIVAFGTSSPELFVSGKAALAGHADIAIGNVIGSNISNILLVLGLSALIYPIAIDKKALRFDNIVMLYGTVVFAFLLHSHKMLNSMEGGILFTLLWVYIVITLWKTHSAKKALTEAQAQETDDQLNTHLSIPFALGFIAGGIALLVYGSDILVEGAVGIARVFDVPESVIGVTLVAIGSSAPEIATCVVAACRKHSDIAIGNIVGSNIFNVLAIMGVIPLIAPGELAVSPVFLATDVWILIAATALLYAVIKYIGLLHRFTGGIFLSGYIAYVAYQFLALS